MPQCPKCSSSNTRKSRKQHSRSRPKDWRQAAYRCDDCGARFYAKDQLRVARVYGAVAVVVLLIGLLLLSMLQNPRPEYPWSELASSTDSPSQGVEYSVFAASEGLHAAAEEGDREAQYRLALVLVNEYDASGELAAAEGAVRWFREAATQGHARAQTELGNRYREGRGVIQDFSQAADWYRQAAAQGDAESMFRLGSMAQSGWGMDEDLVDAYVWLNLASARGERRADPVREQVRARLTTDQLQVAQQRSRELYDAFDAEIDANGTQ